MVRPVMAALGFAVAFAIAVALVPEAPAQTRAGAAHDGDAPARIVSVGGSVTEVVHALGFGDRVVAVDTTSTYPAAATATPKVGYMRQLSAEPILALAPTLVLAIASSGPPAALEQLREAGARVVAVPDDPTPAGIFVKIDAIGAALGARDRADALAASIRRDLDATAAMVAGLSARPRVLFLLSIGNGTPLAAGRDTAAAGVIALAGGVNAIDGFTGYKPLSAEAAVAMAPDIVLVTTRSLDMLGGVDGIAALPGIAMTPAGQARRIVAMDGLLMLGFGPRTPAAVAALAVRFHGDGAETGKP